MRIPAVCICQKKSVLNSTGISESLGAESLPPDNVHGLIGLFQGHEQAQVYRQAATRTPSPMAATRDSGESSLAMTSENSGVAGKHQSYSASGQREGVLLAPHNTRSLKHANSAFQLALPPLQQTAPGQTSGSKILHSTSPADPTSSLTATTVSTT